MDMWVALATAIAVAMHVIIVLNRLTAYKTAYENDFAQIEMQLKRRHDLAGNLLEAAKGYMDHEDPILKEVARARHASQQAIARPRGQSNDNERLERLSRAESVLSNNLGRLQAAMEAHPRLRSDAGVRQLWEELTITENKLAYAREAFNRGVGAYNTYRQSFPPVLIGKLLGHGENTPSLQFEKPEEIRQASP